MSVRQLFLRGSMLILAVPACAPAAVIVQNNKSDYAIRIGQACAEPELFAASELSHYLRLISGASLPVFQDQPSGEPRRVGSYTQAAAAEGSRPSHDIYVGSGAPAELRRDLEGLANEDAYLVSVEGDRVVLAGASPRATLYAVYDFLETLGVGFPRPGHSDISGPVTEEPGPQEETIPRLRTITVPSFKRVERPAFSYRAIVVFYLDKKLAVREIDWMAKNRLNWAHLAINLAPEEWQKQEVRRLLIPEMRRRGIRLQAQGHSFYFYISPERYGREHPEYFATDTDGTRIADPDDPRQRGKGSLCTSNPEVIRLMAERMNRFLEENPEIEIIDLWTNDTGWWCLCPECKKEQGVPVEAAGYMGTTRGYMRFVNRVAGILARRHPKVLVNALAYPMNMYAAPDAPPAANVIVGFAPLGRCLHNVSDDYYTPLYEPGPENTHFHEKLLTWVEQTKNLYMYDYFSLRADAYPLVDTMRKDFAYYKKLGIEKLSTEKVLWNGFNMWAYARLAWDHKIPTRKLIADYSRIAFRAAADPMTKYYTLLENSKWEWPKQRPRLRELLHEAETLAAGKSPEERDATVLLRIAALRKQMELEPAKNWEHKSAPPPLE